MLYCHRHFISVKVLSGRGKLDLINLINVKLETPGQKTLFCGSNFLLQSNPTARSIFKGSLLILNLRLSVSDKLIEICCSRYRSKNPKSLTCLISAKFYITYDCAKVNLMQN